MIPLSPAAVSRGTCAGTAGVLWDRPPELGGASQFWRCRHRHNTDCEAVGCAVTELRERWAAEMAGLPAGWKVRAGQDQNGRAGRWGYLILAPDSLLPAYISQYRWHTDQAALRAAAARGADS
jgi:hypothetical protein